MKSSLGSELFWHPELGSLQKNELSNQSIVRKVALYFTADYQLQIFIERNQALVKCFIEVGSEAETVGGVDTVLGELAPRENVAGYEQFRNRIACYAACPLVSRENGLPKEPLHCSDLHGSR